MKAILAGQSSPTEFLQHDERQLANQLSAPSAIDANIDSMQFALELLDDQFLGSVGMNFPSDEWIFAGTEDNSFPRSVL